MSKLGINNRIMNRLRDNHGTTLIEMIVCFAVLSIFMVCATMLISTITMLYYNIQGEIYSREVSDIVMEKMVSEIDGAEYSKSGLTDPPIIENENTKITLCDKTDTKVSLYNGTDVDADKGLIVDYHEINYLESGVRNDELSRYGTKWFFDSSVYNGFKVKDIKFYSGGSTISAADSSKYGISSMSGYDENVVLILMELEHGKYGTYKYHRYVKMYNVPKTLPAVTPP